MEIWGNSSSVSKLFKLQKKAIRIVHKKTFRSHTDPLFKQSNILKLPDLYSFKLLLLAYDYKNNNLPDSFVDLYTLPDSNISTRQHHNLYTSRPRTTFSAQSISHKLVETWNKMPHEYKTIDNKNVLKKQIKLKFINDYSDSIICNNPRCIECHN